MSYKAASTGSSALCISTFAMLARPKHAKQRPASQNFGLERVEAKITLKTEHVDVKDQSIHLPSCRAKRSKAWQQNVAKRSKATHRTALRGLPFSLPGCTVAVRPTVPWCALPDELPAFRLQYLVLIEFYRLQHAADVITVHALVQNLHARPQELAHPETMRQRKDVHHVVWRFVELRKRMKVISFPDYFWSRARAFAWMDGCRVYWG